ncbi:hypothetical protein J3R82DRAFT_9448 [Butyriboletus roseoflavus]|nr:hypothetical protein J3R82DRAFT_9448 [Butyriboletus roseoflavus]
MWLMACLLILNFGQLGLATVFTMKSYALPALPDVANIRTLGIVALGINTLDDISTAVALCYYLQTMRSSYAQANSLIRSLMVHAVNTGALTSALSFSTSIFYQYMPTNFVFVGCYFVLSKLYAVSFVAALNTRQTIRGRGTECDPIKSWVPTEQRTQSLNIPTAVVEFGDVESRGGEEGSAPDSGELWVTQGKPNSPSGETIENFQLSKHSADPTPLI